MIVTKDTAHRIWLAHREIETAHKLLADIKGTGAEQQGRATPLDRDSRQHLQLGVPLGTGHRLFFLSPELAAQVIAQYIAEQEKELRAASVDALRELERLP